uniref:HAT C-terminal dimerisation domain-containing protein n=1 Tax=Sander lucioperca TaxID=283035 RepID=A0A8D0A9S2_SANLU
FINGIVDKRKCHVFKKKTFYSLLNTVIKPTLVSLISGLTNSEFSLNLLSEMGPWPHIEIMFTLVKVRNSSYIMRCLLCLPKQTDISAFKNLTSNLRKHTTTMRAKLSARSTNVSSSEGDGATLLKQATLDFSGQQQVTKAELNTLIARYVVENMLPLSTVESESFRAILAKIPIRGGGRGVAPCRNTFAKFIDSEYEKINIELKKSFEEIEYISTTADIWTAHNKIYMGVTAHWINPNNMEREKAALACRQFKGHHTHDAIAVELDNIHSTYGITHKITATVTDNGSNFVKAFKRYQPLEESDSEDDEDEVTFTDINDALHRCASHTLNLISCTDVDKWLLSKPATKAVYRSATAKCTALWNKTSRSTLATETVDELVSKKLLVPCTTRWNSFYDALARICEISKVDLNTISSKLGLTAITEREHQFLKEYCTVMKPLTVALDILQGEDNCFHGTLLPTMETLMLKTENHSQVPAHLHITQIQPKRTISFPLRRMRRTPPLQQKTRWQTILNLQHKNFNSLCGFSLIKKISLRYNAATPSSAPVERLFSLGKLVFSPRGTDCQTKDSKKLLLLRYNHWFSR